MLLCGRSRRGVNDLRRGWTQNVVDIVASRAASNDAIGELNPPLTGRHKFNRSEHGTRSTDKEKASTGQQKLRRKLVSQRGCGARSRVFWGPDQSGSLPKSHPFAQRFLDFFSEKVEAVRRSTAGGTVQTMLSQADVSFNTFVCCTINDVKRTITSASEHRPTLVLSIHCRLPL